MGELVKKSCGIVLVIAMLIAMLPTQALAASEDSEDVSGVSAIGRLERGESIDVDFLQENSAPAVESSESVGSTEENASLPGAQGDTDPSANSRHADAKESLDSTSAGSEDPNGMEAVFAEEAETVPVVLAGNDIVSGDYTYTLSNGKASITGYSGNGGSITIPDTLDGYTVVSIGRSAFSNDASIQAVVLPETLTSLGSGAFYNCSWLTSVYIPSSLQGVSAPYDGPFVKCARLDSITFGAGITKVPDHLFKDCAWLTSMTIPDTVTSIGNYAFYQCENLQTVRLSPNLTAIGRSAFSQCASLTAAQLPEGLTSLGSSAFYNCSALTSVYIPSSLQGVSAPYDGPFAGCAQLDGVTFGAGITKIPDHLFKKCAWLTNITIPDTVTSIGNYAFNQCENLQTVRLSPNLTAIGRSAFSHCTSLTAARLPEGLTSLGSSAFNNCSSLTSVYIPSSLQGVSAPYDGPFAGCARLDGVTFGAGTTKIPDHLFKECASLTHMTIPDTVTNIGKRAFSECTNLKHTMIENPSCTIADNAFSNCPGLILYCPYHSLTTIYAIDHEIPFEPSGVFVDNDAYALDHSSTGLFADINSMSANGYVTITLNYKIKDIWAARVSGLAAKIKLPSIMMLDEDTIKVDGSVCTNYSLREDVLTIPLSETRGTIKLSVKMTRQGNVTSYAVMTLKKDGAGAEEIIGVLNESEAVLTLNLPSETAQDTFTAGGLAPASSTVTLYVDGVQNTTAAASKAGSWTAEICIPNPVNNYSYLISASCTDGDKTISQTGSVVYKETAVSMTGFTLKYSESNRIKSCDLLHTNGIKPRVYFVPGTEFKFELEFDRPEQIRNLYVTSTRNGEKKYLEAAYDEDTAMFVTNGFFDPSNKNYIPGTISIEYTKNVPSVSVGQNTDWTALVNQSGINPGSAVNVTETSEKDYKATIDLSTLTSDLGEVFLDAAISIYDEETDGNLSDWLGAFEYSEKIASLMLEGTQGENYLMSLDYSDPYTYAVLVHNLSDDTFIKLVIDGAMNTSQFGKKEYLFMMDLTQAMSTTSTITKLLMNQYEIREEAEELRKEVMSSPGMSDAARNEALKKVDEYEFDKSAFTLLTTVLPLVVAAPVTVGATMSAAPLILFTAILGMMTACSSFFWEFRVGQIKGEKIGLNWVADPSGYVYDLDTLERMEDVTVTAYYIPYDDTDEFWSNIPRDDEYGTVWNAGEYNQENPLLTNGDGKYAWDVPEGWWRVKYVKEGYETTWSGWMTVPPLQTEVNIGMVSATQSAYSIKLTENTDTSAALLLTNHTAGPAAVRFIAAAYDGNGKMIGVNTVNQTLSASGDVKLSVSYAADAEVRAVKAFVLASDTMTPLRAIWSRQVSD